MKVITNQGALRAAVEKLLEDRSVSSARIDTIAGNVGKDEEPIEPTPIMSTQLAVERPPVDDPDFIPSSIQELSRAAAAIAAEVPPEQIEFFYRKLHNILDETLDRLASSDEDSLVEEEEGEEKVEEEEVEDADIFSSEVRGPMYESVLKKVVSILTEQDAASNVAVNDIVDRFKEIDVGYEPEEYESIVSEPGKKYKKPMRPEKMKLDLARALVTDDVAKEILGRLSPNDRQEVIRRVHSAYSIQWSDLFASPEVIEQLKYNREVDIESRELLKTKSKEEVAQILFNKAESEQDPRRKKAYNTIALLTVKGESMPTPAKPPPTLPEISPEQARQAELDRIEKNVKKLDSMAPFFGFKNASGIRQWRRKFAEPKFKAMMGSITGHKAYEGYAEKIMDNMSALLDEFLLITERTIVNIDDQLNKTPDDEELKEIRDAISTLKDQFQQMISYSLEDESGELPVDSLFQQDSGYMLRSAFSEMYFDKQFRDFARGMKKNMVEFLTSKGVDAKIANIFAKMFNGEVDLVTLGFDSSQAKKLRDGGITPEIYKLAIEEEQRFIKEFFTGEYQRKADSEFLKRLRDKKYLAQLFQKSIDLAMEAVEMESELDKFQQTGT